MTRSDGELVEASRRGDRDAFRELFERYFRRILSVATGILRNNEDARDVSQETFIKAYRNLDRFKGDSAFYTWIYRIAVNLCIDAQRRAGRSSRVRVESQGSEARGARGETDRTIDLRDEQPGADPFDHVRSGEIRGELRAALDELTPEHRAVIVLREVEGLSYDEISQVMQCAKGTVMSRLHYARKKLQQRLQGVL